MGRPALLAIALLAAATPRPGGADERAGTLAPGQVHRLPLPVAAGQLVRVSVRKEGADLDVRLLGPDGRELARSTTLVFPPGAASFGYRAAVPARCVLALRLAVPVGASRYVAAIDVRAARDGDEARLAAEEAYRRGELSRIDGAKEALEAAGAAFEQALALDAGRDAVLAADATTGLARVRDAQGDKKAALPLYERALAAHRASGRDAALANTLGNLALVYDHLGQRDAALEVLADAAAAAQRAGDSRALGLVLNNTALVQLNLGNKADARLYYEEALPLHRAAANLRGEANTLAGLATVLDSMGEKARALEVMEQALALRTAAGDRRDLAALLNNIGQLHSSLENVGAAVDYYGRALEAWRAVGDRTGEAATLHNLASVHEAAGEYQQALALWKQALPLFRATSAEARAAGTLSNMGRLYVSLGDPAQGVPLLEEALATHRAAGNRAFEAATLANLGAARALAGDAAGALALHEQALALRRALKEPLAVAGSLREVARAQAALGAHDRALALLDEAQALYRGVSRRRGEAGVLVDVSASLLALRDAPGALAAAEAGLALYRQTGNPRGEASALLAAARAEAAQDRLDAARARLEAAVSLLEGLRAGLAAPELRTAFLASVQDYYELLIDVLMRLHRQRPEAGLDAAALEVAERAHARGLLDVLAEAGSGIRQGAEPALLQRERALHRRLNARAARQARAWSGSASDEEARALARELDALTAELRAVRDELREKSPRYAALAQPQPLDAAAIRARVLDPDTVLVEYALGTERSYAWAVTAAGGITSRELAPRSEIEARARRFYDAARRPLGGADAAGRALADAVLVPLGMDGGLGAPEAPPRRLFVVPDGALHLVPFGALPGADGQPLVAGHEVVTLSSASTVAVLREESAARGRPDGVVAVLADPVFETADPRVRARLRGAAPTAPAAATRAAEAAGPLPRLVGSRREADAILALAPPGASLRAVDFDASRATATGGRLARYRIVHFATHGVVDHARPELSGVVLSMVDGAGRPQDGVLRLHDVYNLAFKADLVVLSACDTALGPSVRGEGLIGLTRGFLYAGARSVLATLWRVDDAATAQLMRRFYAGLLGPRRLRPAEALRAAQAELAGDPRWADPYHWAAFVLQGDWR